MNIKRLALVTMVLLVAAGCQSLHVESYPSGATILIDDNAQTEKTPYEYSLRHFGAGSHVVAVVKDGYKTVTPSQHFVVEKSIDSIVLSIFPNVLLRNLISEDWKKITPEVIKPFDLVADTSQVKSNRSEEKLSADQGNVAERIKQLNALREQKLITEEEYTKKRQLLIDKL